MIEQDTFFYVFLNYVYLFMIGSMIGYVIELLFRRFVSMKRWINPGFLKGPYLPLYGFGTCALYLISDLLYENLTDSISSPSYYAISGVTPSGSFNFYLVAFITFIVTIIVMTLIEYIGGVIFVNGLHIKLWDYSSMKGNIQGIICPLFSLIWGVIGLLYFLFLHPCIYVIVSFFNHHVWGMTFILGIFTACIVLDFIESIKLSISLNKEARLKKVNIDFEKYKINMRDKKVKSTKLEQMKEAIEKASLPISKKVKEVANEAKKYLYVNNEIPTQTAAEIDETPRMKSERLKKEENNLNKEDKSE